MIVGAHNRKVYDPVHNSRHLSLFLLFVGQRRGKGRSCRKLPQRKKCGGDLSHRTHFLCPECPLTFPELLFIWGCVGCERSLLNCSIYEWHETKTQGTFWAVMRSLPEGSGVLNYQRGNPQIHLRGPARRSCQDGLRTTSPSHLPGDTRAEGRLTALWLHSSKGNTETAQSRMSFYTEDTPATYTLKTKFLGTSTVSWMYFYYYFIPWSIYLTYTEFYNGLLSQKWPKNYHSAFSNEMQRKPSSPTKSLEKVFAYSTVLEASKRKWTIFLKQQNTGNLRWHTTAAM